MKSKMLAKLFLLSFFVLFLTLLFANMSGYYQTRTVRKKELTEEQIKQFEEDISSGKEVDIKDYLLDEEVDYTNKLSIDIYNASLKLEKIVDSTIKYIFNGAFKLVAD